MLIKWCHNAISRYNTDVIRHWAVTSLYYSSYKYIYPNLHPTVLTSLWISMVSSHKYIMPNSWALLHVQYMMSWSYGPQYHMLYHNKTIVVGQEHTHNTNITFNFITNKTIQTVILFFSLRTHNEKDKKRK